MTLGIVPRRSAAKIDVRELAQLDHPSPAVCAFFKPPGYYYNSIDYLSLQYCTKNEELITVCLSSFGLRHAVPREGFVNHRGR